MNLKVEILKKADNTIASEVWPNWDWNAFWWHRGNASCDCNRAQFYHTALGLPDPDIECSTHLYSVRCTDNDTGEILYDEISPDKNAPIPESKDPYWIANSAAVILPNLRHLIKRMLSSTGLK